MKQFILYHQQNQHTDLLFGHQQKIRVKITNRYISNEEAFKILNVIISDIEGTL